MLAVGRPHEALARARAVLAGHPNSYEASVAHQAAGIVARDLGNAQEGVRELRIALRLARQTGSITRETDVLATLGAALVHAGHTADGFAALDQAVQQSSGVLAGRVLHRRAMALWALGRHAAALDDLRHAIGILRRADDRIYTARALTARGLVYTDLGSPGRADADFVAAERLFAETGQDLESIYVVHNRAMTAFVAGDLLAALSCLDEAARGYRLLNAPNPSLSIDRCTVLLAAGLAADALAEADAAVRDIEQSHGRPTWKAVLLLTAARCALAANQPQAAQDWAQAACRLFRSQQSAWWQAHAAGVLAQAKYATGLASAKLLRESDRAAFSLEMVGSSDVARAHLLAGRVALKLGRPGDAGRHFTKAAQSRHRGPHGPGPAAGSARHSGPRSTAICAACSALAARDSRCSMSISSPWVRRNCGRKPPPMAPNWPRWRSAMRHRPIGRGFCWPGVSAGGPPRSPSPRCGRLPTRSLVQALPRCARRQSAWRRPARPPRQHPSSGNSDGLSGNSDSLSAWYVRVRSGPRALLTKGLAPSGFRSCSMSLARPGWWRSSTSTASCTCWSAGPEECGSSPLAGWQTRPMRLTSPALPFAAWPAAGPGTRWTARWPS